MVLDVELRLCAHHLQAQMEPDISGDIDRAGETWPIVDLPVASGVENRRVLQGVGKPGFVGTEIDRFEVEALMVDAKVKAEEPALRGGCDVHIDDRIAHFKVFQNRRSTIE
ncbi:MAG: hypothetical protein WA172_10020 [Terriglobales bacterium]